MGKLWNISHKKNPRADPAMNDNVLSNITFLILYNDVVNKIIPFTFHNAIKKPFRALFIS